jgi:hypothetical protein
VSAESFVRRAPYVPGLLVHDDQGIARALLAGYTIYIVITQPPWEGPVLCLRTAQDVKDFVLEQTGLSAWPEGWKIKELKAVDP